LSSSATRFSRTPVGHASAPQNRHCNDRIPLDHPEYLAYARQDVALTQALSALYPMTPYGRPEHTVLAIAGEMSLSGFRVDEDALAAKLTARDAVAGSCWPRCRR